MNDFILNVIVACAWIWGVFAAFDEGNILWGFRKLSEATIGSYWCMPVFGCPYCMASLHGGAIGLYLYGFSPVVIPFIFCVCGVNFVIKQIIYPS